MLNILSRCTKTCTSLLLAASALIWTGHAHAIVGAIDTVPSATLLLPYFEADLGNPNGGQTVMRMSNSSATAMLTHLTLWTDLGVPTLQFDMYLDGYDSVDLDFRLLFQGIVPQTASAGSADGLLPAAVTLVFMFAKRKPSLNAGVLNVAALNGASCVAVGAGVPGT